jgi:TIR domain
MLTPREATHDPDLEFDLFVCHASEDKDLVARPLTRELEKRGLHVWLDELQLTLGDSLHGRIDSGLARSRFGVVVVSPAFFAKDWPQRELAGLAAKEAGGSKVILPVWHEVDRDFIAKRSPILADRIGARTELGIPDVADRIATALDRAAGRAAGGPDLQPPPPRRLAGYRPSMFAVAVFAATALAGYAVAPGGSSTATSRTLPNSAANELLEVAFPGDWTHTDGSRLNGVLRLQQPLSFRPRTGGGALLLGAATSTSPTLLPETVLSSIGSTPVPETVELGGGLLYRYRGIQPSGQIGSETIYARPTTTGVLIAVCLLPEGLSATVERECEGIVGSVKMSSAKFLVPGPQPNYARAVGKVSVRLNEASARQRDALARARSNVARARESAGLAATTATAVDALQGIDPGAAERTVDRSLRAQLRRLESGYTQIARAENAGSTRRFAEASGVVRSASRSIARDLGQLRAYGYRVAP